MEEEKTKEKMFLFEKGLLESKDSCECFEISIPVLIEKKYSIQKGSLFHRGKYIVAEEGQKIMEIKCSSNNKSIFYGNSLLEDKNLYTVHEIDPVFLAIYYLEFARGKKTSENEGKFLKLDEIMSHQTEKEQKFANILVQNQRFLRGLSLICDKKEINFDEIHIYYRLNDGFLFKWLDAKVKMIEDAMKTHLPHRIVIGENNEKMPIFDFLYENLPFSVFDNYLVKHHNLTQNEFGKYKQSLNLVQKNVANQENEKIETGTSNKKVNKKKEVAKPIPQSKNPITNYFKK